MYGIAKHRSNNAPTPNDGSFHNQKPEYAEHSIQKAMMRGRMTPEDAALVRMFIAELKGSKGISNNRANNSPTTSSGGVGLLGRSGRIPSSIFTEGMARFRSCIVKGGNPIKQNTIYDFMQIIKRFYRWLIENEYSTYP